MNDMSEELRARLRAADQERRDRGIAVIGDREVNPAARAAVAALAGQVVHPDAIVVPVRGAKGVGPTQRIEVTAGSTMGAHRSGESAKLREALASGSPVDVAMPRHSIESLRAAAQKRARKAGRAK